METIKKSETICENDKCKSKNLSITIEGNGLGCRAHCLDCGNVFPTEPIGADSEKIERPTQTKKTVNEDKQ